MNKATARNTLPSAQGQDPTQATEDALDEYDPLAPGDDLGGDDDFNEFGAFAKLAGGTRIKGTVKSIDIPKMRSNRDAGAGRKFNKPLHKDKRGP